MFVKNNFKDGYVNGTLGTVIGFEVMIFRLLKPLKGRR